MLENIYDSYENSFYDIKLFSILGTCQEQEDFIGCEMNDTDALLVLCDGMGGMRGGRRSAAAAVNKVLELYRLENPTSEPKSFLTKAIEIADEEVFLLKDECGKRIGGGCTVLIALVVGRKIYYANVGDSRIYHYSKEAFVQLSEDHNYEQILKKSLLAGEITQDEYNEKMIDGAALTGYLGLGEVREAYVCENPLLLDREQVLCMQSDGLYKLLSNEEMREIISNNIRNLEKMGEDLLNKAKANRISYQDNTSFILLRLK